MGATWKTKTAVIEQEMEDMDNMADSPEADVTSTLATSAERRQSMAADLKEFNKKEEAKKPPPFTPPVKVRDDSESEVEDAEPEAQKSEPEAQESEPEEEDDDGPDLFKKDSPPTIRRQTRDITPEESEEEDSEEEEESEEESD